MNTKKQEVIHRYLSNGMEVYLYPTDFSPLASLYLTVKTGALDEDMEERGAAHVLEHMLFKGTKNFPEVGQVASEVEYAGGDINAYTTYDHTCYHLTAPTHFIERGTDLLLDMAHNSLIDKDELNKELEVVAEEIRRSADSPDAVGTHSLFSTFYQHTRMEESVLGTRERVKGFSRELVFSFYEKWYVPNNMIFIAVGQFDPACVLEKLEELAKDFPARSLPLRTRPTYLAENETFCAKELTRKGPWQEVRFRFATPAPLLEDADMPAWDVFASILGDSDTSRLYRTLKDEKQLVTNLDCSCYSPKHTKGLFGIGFFAPLETSFAAVDVIVKEIIKLVQEPPTRDELNRVLTALKAQRIYAQESTDGIARNANLGLQTSHKMRFEEYYLDSVQKVTQKTVQDIATRILKQIAGGNFSVSVVCNEKAPAHINGADFCTALQDLAQSYFTKEESFKDKEKSIFCFQQIQSARHQDVRQIVIPLPLQKTLKINFLHSERLPVTSAMLALRGGTVCEEKEHNGVSGLTANLLTQGTTRQTYRKFSEELEDNAASISAFSTKDIFGVRFDCMSEQSPRIGTMMLDCFFRPEFSYFEYQKIQKETLEVLLAERDHPTARLSRALQRLLFLDHPYGLASLGTEDSVRKLTRNDTANYWRNLFSANEFIFSLAGKFDLHRLVDLVEGEFQNQFQAMGEINGAETFFNLLPSALCEQDNRIAFEEIEREQAHIALAFRAFPMSDPRRTILEVAANILAGQGGRLFLDLRDKRSLAYSVSASQTPNLLAGSFTTYIATAAHKCADALLGLKQHIERLASSLPEDAEVTRAQNALLGSQSNELQHIRYQASQLAMGDVYGLGFDNFLGFAERVKAVTPTMIRETFAELLEKNPPLVAIAGPQGTQEKLENIVPLKWGW